MKLDLQRTKQTFGKRRATLEAGARTGKLGATRQGVCKNAKVKGEQELQCKQCYCPKRQRWMLWDLRISEQKANAGYPVQEIHVIAEGYRLEKEKINSFLNLSTEDLRSSTHDLVQSTHLNQPCGRESLSLTYLATWIHRSIHQDMHKLYIWSYKITEFNFQ